MIRARLRRLRLGWSHIRWALSMVRSLAPQLFVIAVLISAVQAILPVLIALSVRGLVNSVGLAARGIPLLQTSAYPWLLVGFVATLAGSAGNTVQLYLGRRFESELKERLNLAIVRHHVIMPLERMESRDYLNALRRAQSNPEGHVSQLFSSSLELACKGLQMLSLLIVLVAIEPLLLALLVPIGLPFLVFRWRLVRRQFQDFNRRTDQERRISYYGGLLTDLEHSGEIKLLALESTLIDRYHRLLDALQRLRLDYLNIELSGSLVFVFFSVSAIYFAMLHALPVIVAGRLTIGDLAIFGGAASQLRGLVDQSINQFSTLRWQLLSVEKLRQFLGIDPGTARVGHRASVPVLEGRIELRDIRFRYPGAAVDILRGLSFTIEPGETVALVGENGAGKSTVAKLVARLYDVQEGALLFDGHDARQLDTRQLQRQVACVFQQFGRYETTAAETLAFGDWPRLGPDPAAIEAVARRARVHDLITGMPEGYRTMLGRRFGSFQPSGGQWQQLAIARLIGRDSRILILDEPSANLDVMAEAALFERFRTLAAGRTTLLISHRFSTVSMADRILVLDQGRIVEDGSHQQLMALNGRYAALFALAYRYPEAPAVNPPPSPA